jgi:hypothetical protein
VLQRLSPLPNAGAAEDVDVDEFAFLDEEFAVRTCEGGGVDDVAADSRLRNAQSEVK